MTRRHPPTNPTYPLPGAIGWGVMFAWVGAFDAWALLTKRPTMSRTLGHYLAHPVLGPLLAGAGLGVVYHLLIEELIPAWWVEQQRTQPTPR